MTQSPSLFSLTDVAQSKFAEEPTEVIHSVFVFALILATNPSPLVPCAVTVF